MEDLLQQTGITRNLQSHLRVQHTTIKTTIRRLQGQLGKGNKNTHRYTIHIQPQTVQKPQQQGQ